jgi:PAS domain S-box-containing protein
VFKADVFGDQLTTHWSGALRNAWSGVIRKIGSTVMSTDAPLLTSNLKVQIGTDWERAIDALTQLVVVLDDRGRVVRANRTLERWKIGKQIEANGHSLHELLHRECQSPHCVLKDVWTSAQADLASIGAWTHEVDDDVLQRRLTIEICPADGVGAVVVIEDVTNRRTTEATLRSGHAMLEQQVTARTRDLLYSNAKLRNEIDVRKHTEQELRKSEESYRRLVDTMLEGLLVHDPHGAVVYANESMCRMFGVARASLVGEPVQKIFTNLKHRVLRECHDHLCVEPCRRYETEWERENGEQVTALVTTQRLDGPNGENLGDFSVMMDITDRKRSERAMRVLSTQILAAQEVERKRIADELHDSIATTLGALKFEVENAAELAAQGDVHALSKILTGLVPKFQAATDEVRRISTDLRPSMLDDLGVLPTLAWFCREYQNVYRSLELEVNFDLREEDVPTQLKTAIYRIVQESLSNIARHAKAKRVQLRLHCNESSLELGVTDDGVGFDPTAVPVGANDRHGLGLSTMRERAEGTGGTFYLEAERGAGTKLRASWPRCGRAG